jgi:hypothetical protein
MASNEKTSADVAKLASKGLKDPASLTNVEIRQLAASALTQAADTPAKKKPKKKVAAKSVGRKPMKKKPAKKKR